jgi:hypothetical protein
MNKQQRTPQFAELARIDRALSKSSNQKQTALQKERIGRRRMPAACKINLAMKISRSTRTRRVFNQQTEMIDRQRKLNGFASRVQSID